MKQPYLSFTPDELFGDCWEYLLLAPPDRRTNHKAKKEKKRFYDTYEQDSARDTPPHITIARFTANGNLEQKFVALMQSACRKHQCFLVELYDFNGYEAHTIFIKVKDHMPFRDLANSLSILNPYLCENTRLSTYLVTEPHMTIAKGIDYRIYVKAIDEYRNRSFFASFLVSQLVLIKRRHSGEKYQHVAFLTLPSWSDYLIS